jgi:flagellar biosynthesis/type III secretory pathway protein FliH
MDMSNKQQTPVEWLLNAIETKNGEEFSSYYTEFIEQAKEMEIAGKEMSYAEGYKEGYKRALEMVEWYIKNYIGGMVQDHIGDTNKKVDE